jgi:hypothetical protein
MLAQEASKRRGAGKRSRLIADSLARPSLVTAKAYLRAATQPRDLAPIKHAREQIMASPVKK